VQGNGELSIHLVNVETMVPIFMFCQIQHQNPHPTILAVSDLAVGDHLVGNLCEKVGHAFLGAEMRQLSPTANKQSQSQSLSSQTGMIFRQASVVL
jgi:hypothetical protein